MGGNLVEGDSSASCAAPQAPTQAAQNIAQGDNATPPETEEEQSPIADKRRVVMAVMRILDSGSLDEKSLRLLERQTASSARRRRWRERRSLTSRRNAL